jgi:hypothetical protein
MFSQVYSVMAPLYIAYGVFVKPYSAEKGSDHPPRIMAWFAA